jgi:hypothetical protein
MQQAIATGVADVRCEPSAVAELVTQTLLGTPAIAQEERDGWTHVTLPDYEGWVATAQLAAPATPAGPWGVVVGQLLAPLYAAARGNVRLDTVFLATVLPLRARAAAGRLAVALPGDRTGWVDATDALIRPLAEPFPRATPASAVDVAWRFLDVPYLWGGVTARGIDCSGLAQLCLRIAGYTLPRDSAQQCRALSTLVGGPAEPGDLLFFGRTGRITHVALALGGGEIIHAEGQQHHRVRIDSLDPAAPNYSKRLAEIYLTTRRVI